MKSANFHHHQQEDHELVDASPVPTPCYGLPWPQYPILTSTNNSINSINIVPCLDTMVQDLELSWITGTNNRTEYPIESFKTHELQRLARIRDELSVAESYPKFLELLNCSPTSGIESLHLHPYTNSLASFSSDCQIKGGQNSSNRTFSQIFPTISITSLNQSCSSSSPSSPSRISSTSFDMNCLPALDLFRSPKFKGNLSHLSSLNPHIICRLSHGVDGMHDQPSYRPSVCPSKISSVSTTRSTTDQSSKRPANKCIDATCTQPVVAKKPKSRPSSAPFQVRKEKLGDRIAAIQQVVAPFGKTDTASVLMEAIGYIKFLQTQVKTLSVPYMKSTDKIGEMLSREGGQMEDGNKDAKRDLRSRGLCLVPLSCLSYVTDGGDAIWSVS